jgi:hypothetical protein
MKKILLYISIPFMFASCDSILTPDMYGSLTADQYYQDVNSMSSLLNGCYAQLREDGCYKNAAWSVGDIRTDVAYFGEDDELNITRLDGQASSIWSANFTGINRCNVLLNRADKITYPDNQSDLKNQFMGQGYFLRALYYFNLVRYFGDVPMITEELKNTNEGFIARTVASTIYDEVIIKDLEKAIQLLPEKYGTSSNTGGVAQETGRATKYAAYMMLADVYLTRKDYAKAKQTALNVYQKFTLLPNYGDLFAKPYVGNSDQFPTENTAESIFEVQFSDQAGLGSNMTWLMSPQSWEGTGLRYCMPTDSENINANATAFKGKGIVQEMESNDKRRIVFYESNNPIDINPNTGKPFKVCGKYLVRKKNNSNDPANFFVYRYAETLLLLAEAENELNGPADAYKYINEVRNRAGIEPLSGLTKEQFRAAVLQERKLELCFEGKRWFDLVRTGNMTKVMSAHIGRTIPEYMNLLPVPQYQIDINKVLTQNPGY